MSELPPRKLTFHFCGCFSAWELIGGTWKLAGFEQRCAHRWRMGHFGFSEAEEKSAADAEAAAAELGEK